MYVVVAKLTCQWRPIGRPKLQRILVLFLHAVQVHTLKFQHYGELNYLHCARLPAKSICYGVVLTRKILNHAAKLPEDLTPTSLLITQISPRHGLQPLECLVISLDLKHLPI